MRIDNTALQWLKIIRNALDDAEQAAAAEDLCAFRDHMCRVAVAARKAMRHQDSQKTAD